MDREQLLPHNSEAERGVLGSILIDPAALVAALDLLTPDDFYIAAHRDIYAAMLDVHARREPVDLITLTDELQRLGKLDAVGGASYVSSLGNQVPTSQNARVYARHVADKALLRRLIEVSGQIAAMAYNETDVEGVTETARILLETALLRHNGTDSTDIAHVVDAFLATVEEAVTSGTQPGIEFGFRALDAHLFGLLPGELAYLAGRPGSGKSALAAAIAVNVARRYGGVEWVSLEMSEVQQAKRIITSWAGVNGRLIRSGFRHSDGTFDEGAYASVQAAAREVRETLRGRLRLYDQPMTMSQLRQHARRAVYKRGCRLLILDYLGLVEGDNARDTDYARVSKISRHLKQLALELHLPVLCLVQMNRESERRANKRPTLPDLRDSGGLEQDADVVLGVYRGAYYDPEAAERDPYFAQFGELIVLKMREGVANVTIPFRYEGEMTRPSDWPPTWPYAQYLKLQSGED
jgi:replicative DNA helicase